LLILIYLGWRKEQPAVLCYNQKAMRLLARIIIAVVVNALGLLAASTFIPGFHITASLQELLILAAIFTALYLVLRPIVKMILGPFLVLTLGLGLIVVNAIMLYLLDFIAQKFMMTQNLSVTGFLPVLEASLLLSVLNFLLHYAEKD